MVADQLLERVRDADAGQREIECVGRIRHQRGARGLGRCDPLSVDQLPFKDAAGPEPVTDAIVLMQVGDRLRSTLGIKIAARGHQDCLQRRGQAQRDHVLLHRLAEPDAGIEALRDDVDKRVVDEDLDRQLGLSEREPMSIDVDALVKWALAKALSEDPGQARTIEPTTVRVLYDPARHPAASPPPPAVDPNALLIGFPSNTWEATPEQRHELIGIMRSRYPDEAAPELLEMLRTTTDEADRYEMLLGRGQEGEWGPPDRFHEGGDRDPPMAPSVADNWGSIDRPLHGK